MKLYYDKRIKDPTYYAQQGIRIGNKTTTRNVKNFGKHSELKKITNDPLTYVKTEIEKMNQEYRSGKVSLQINTDFNEKVISTDDSYSSTTWLNIGYFFLQYFIKDLNLKKFCNQITNDKKILFDSYSILRFLTYTRIIDPNSKLATCKKLCSYFEQLDFKYHDVLRFMDILAEHYSEFIEWLWKNSNNIIKRDTSVLYYDCTNFYCEIEKPDEEVVDEVTGELIKGLRQYGVSKEHRPNPIVEMGLFMDSNGIPITMSLHPGNTSEQLTAIPLEKEIIKMIPDAKFIYCADAGLGSYNIRKFNSMGGRAFIVTQSIKKLNSALKDAVFNDYDYRLLSNDSKITIEKMKSFDRFDEKNLNIYNDFAYKIIQADKAIDLGLYEEVKLKNGKTKKKKATGILSQRIIVTFSRKMMEYQRTIRNKQIERAKILLKNKDPEEIKKGPNDVRRFLKRTSKTNEEIKYVLDEAKIEEEKKYDGFYAVATNLTDPAKDILDVARKRYQIEDCFRIMKTNFDGRPINHRLPNRIQAHFMFCFTALLITRLIEHKLNLQKTHVTTDDLINTLKNMNVANVHNVEYLALYKDSKSLEALNKLTNLNLDKLHYKPKELNLMIKKLLKS